MSRHRYMLSYQLNVGSFRLGIYFIIQIILMCSFNNFLKLTFPIQPFLNWAWTSLLPLDLRLLKTDIIGYHRQRCHSYLLHIPLGVWVLLPQLQRTNNLCLSMPLCMHVCVCLSRFWSQQLSHWHVLFPAFCDLYSEWLWFPYCIVHSACNCHLMSRWEEYFSYCNNLLGHQEVFSDINLNTYPFHRCGSAPVLGGFASGVFPVSFSRTVGLTVWQMRRLEGQCQIM